MARERIQIGQKLPLICGWVILLAVCGWVAAEPAPQAVAAYNKYIAAVESRLVQQHATAGAFLAIRAADPQNERRLKNGELIVEQIEPRGGKDLPGAMLHDWRGAAFVPGARGADFERLMRDYAAYPQHYAPEVLAASVLAHDGDHYQVKMRVRQKHVITVVLDTTYDVTCGRLDSDHGYSLSRSTVVAEIEEAGTSSERALGPNEDHGFLWRLNTYWSYEERDGGLYIEIESVSLTRSIPYGLAWVVGPFVESVPRESLEFTLRATRDALRK
jgi:hypothetical protein